MRRLAVAAALAVAVVLAFEVAPASEIRVAIPPGLLVLGMTCALVAGIITGSREVRTARFWILAGLVLVSLAALRLR